jgi:transposase
MSLASVSPYQCFVGVDIAAVTFTVAWLDAAPSPDRPQQFANTPAGFAALQQRLQTTGVAPAATLVAMEATGSYWVALAVALHQAGYVVSVLNPAAVHNFAKSYLRRAKTDALDARLLAQFAAERQPAAWSPPPEVYHQLRQRLVARDALLEMRKQAQNHRHALLQWPVVIESVRQQLDEVVISLNERIATLETEIAQVLQDGAWAASATLLLSIPGVGVLTTAWLLVTTLNFGLCATPEAAAAYAGLVPMPWESGTSVRGRPAIGHGGNSHLRRALYMATLSAARRNPLITAFYQRLREAGKPMKVARCAAARKLLHLAWAVVTRGRPFEAPTSAPEVLALVS